MPGTPAENNYRGQVNRSFGPPRHDRNKRPYVEPPKYLDPRRRFIRHSSLVSFNLHIANQSPQERINGRQTDNLHTLALYHAGPSTRHRNSNRYYLYCALNYRLMAHYTYVSSRTFCMTSLTVFNLRQRCKSRRLFQARNAATKRLCHRSSDLSVSE